MKKKAAIGSGIAAMAVVVTVMSTTGFFHDSSHPAVGGPPDRPGLGTMQARMKIVAAENFWGSLASQIGGSHVQVISIVSDPNADPHEYETSTADAQAVADANYVIVNGAGYDNWAIKIINAEGNPNQKILDVASLLGKKEGDNPHFWYDPAYVNQTVRQMYSDLVSMDPPDREYYGRQYADLNSSLGQYDTRIGEIKRQFSGAHVAATEDIFVYLANATGLDLISPPEFMGAVAEGNEPPARSVVEFQKQLQDRGENVSVLVYNKQTVTPLTQVIKSMAVRQGIPVVGLTETIQPPGLPFQDWMNAEIVSLQDALNSKAQVR
ncbi:MAG: zinc ABC transporter substrate-binding protein [Thaumarchaeota archaeon]|nr:zinc ABC transporter substrate-binding protein [Nitrososphaerota archaeon]